MGRSVLVLSRYSVQWQSLHNDFRVVQRLAQQNASNTEIQRSKEFNNIVKELNLLGPLQTARLTTKELCTIIAADNKRVLDWLRRSDRLRRRGIEPGSRPNYWRALREQNAILDEAVYRRNAA